ncbi:NAD(+) synthase [Nakamurella aerolata]|uniref:Glutamine-dependent NAD(+) synthetase n=1 Tax=Nakamurella aerolata TaxID=1656892 RepID=A0A849A6A2_9ACTN|nr:NAD(+) synthase [Nakamurella aerolata]NNG35577.1 NAD(+) synthase [Nakamurella aerolata]
MDFFAAESHGFARVAACTMPQTIADPAGNASAIIAQLNELAPSRVTLAVFPELALSGYAIDDLLLQDAVLDQVEAAIGTLAAASLQLEPVIVVGAPLRHRHRLYNCAVVIHRGRVLGVAPKSYLPNYREFYEKRHFAAGDELSGETITLSVPLPHPVMDGPGETAEEIPFGPDLLFRSVDVPGFTFFAEVCEDMWVPVPPSAEAALAGATVLLNLSGSPITVARAEDRKLLCRSASARCLAAYVYSAAGAGESSTDLSWDGQTMVYECGDLLGETDRFPDGPRATVVDVDLDRIRQDRLRQGSFDDNARQLAGRLVFRTVEFDLGRKPFSLLTPQQEPADTELLRPLDRFPFVPNDPQRLALDCYEAYNIQVYGLARRLESIGKPTVVIGVSGGLDSTHALIVAARAMDQLGRPRSDILAYTLPGFATSEHTKNNATRLCAALGVSFAEIDIRPAAEQMLRDIGHPFADGKPVYDTTFENVQAGLRTDYLFRIAGHRGGIVLGTGDLSELALGWCTYGVGDQMSHYGVNAGVPKTLIQHLIRWVISERLFSDEAGEILESILNTEISPELVPATDGAQPQSTQAVIGPYNLQDFTLYYVLRYGFRPSKIAYLAWQAWHDAEAGEWPPGYGGAERPAYTLAEIKHWMEVFLRRFFAFSQFKRSALPNGPKVSAGGSLSPRGDWRAPSDGTATAWLADWERIPG